MFTDKDKGWYTYSELSLINEAAKEKEEKELTELIEGIDLCFDSVDKLNEKFNNNPPSRLKEEIIGITFPLLINYFKKTKDMIPDYFNYRGEFE